MPLMWEFVLAADDAIDLADPGRGEPWYRKIGKLYGEPFDRPAPEQSPELALLRAKYPLPPPWPESVRETWTTGIRALRGVARELHGVKTRPPGKGDHQYVMATYLDLLRISFVDGFARPMPYAPIRELPAGAEWDAKHANGISGFFQRVFGSLVELAPGVFPVCAKCGRAMPPTDTGRASRAELCKSCKFKKWSSSRPDAEKRARWRRDQKRHRAKKKK